MFKISLIIGAQTAIAGANIICTLVGFVLSIICVRKKETRGKYYLHDCICFMVVTDCRVWRICTIFDFCKMSCFAMPINFIKFNFVK